MLVLPLNDRHDRKGFDCGDGDLNAWLSQTARQHKEKGISSNFVAVAEETSLEVLGFYAISVSELVNADLPAQYRNAYRTRFPCFVWGDWQWPCRIGGKASENTCSSTPLTA
jgi:hypothetical protein